MSPSLIHPSIMFIAKMLCTFCLRALFAELVEKKNIIPSIGDSIKIANYIHENSMTNDWNSTNFHSMHQQQPNVIHDIHHYHVYLFTMLVLPLSPWLVSKVRFGKIFSTSRFCPASQNGYHGWTQQGRWSLVSLFIVSSKSCENPQ